MEIRVTSYVNAFDLALYLSKKIGKSVEVGDTNNYSDYAVLVQRKELDQWDQNVLDEFLSTGWLSMERSRRVVMTYAANMGWIEEGNYVIRVSW
jgi:hypothetical protein